MLLKDYLPLPEGRYSLALNGGGGKSSFMYRLAREEAAAGKAVVVGTTTNIMRPAPEEAALLLDTERLPEVLAPGKVVCPGVPAAAAEKIAGPPERYWRGAAAMADCLILETDGAKRLPTKVCREGEPVVPPWIDCLLGVAGLDAVGRPFREVCFRAELACALLGVLPEDPVEPRHLAALLLSGQGQRKGLPPGASYAVVLNKADDSARIAAAEEVAALVQARCPDCPVLVTALKENGPVKAFFPARA